MKKDETRFTIRFNLADPRHRKAKEVLETAGRRKASLIADAVWEYLARYGDIESVIPMSSIPMSYGKIQGDESHSNEPQTIKHIKSDLAGNSQDNEMRQTILDGSTAFTS